MSTPLGIVLGMRARLEIALRASALAGSVPAVALGLWAWGAAAQEDAVAPIPVAAQEKLRTHFDAQDPGSVAAAMREMGLEVELEHDEGPYIRSTTEDDLAWYASFFGCKSGVRCQLMLIESSFELERGLALRRINEWNRDMFVGRAYLDDDDWAVIEHAVVIEGGMSFETLEVVTERWAEALGEFAEHIGYR